MRFVFAGIFVCLGSWLFAGPPPAIKFIENKNQWHPGVHYSARIPGGDIEIRDGQFVYYFLDNASLNDLHHRRHLSKAHSHEHGEELIDGVKLNIEFIGANKSSVRKVLDALRNTTIFLLGMTRPDGPAMFMVMRVSCIHRSIAESI